MNPENIKCGVCTEAITNPVCPQCLAEEMKSWAADISRRKTRKKVVKMVNDAKAMFTPLKEGAAYCIICKKEMYVCAHCFSKEVWEMLNGPLPELEEEFLTHFDYDLRFRLNTL